MSAKTKDQARDVAPAEYALSSSKIEIVVVKKARSAYLASARRKSGLG